ncbi:hypothetical protein CRUP_015961, partial [Coryphaenoides rupestris]
MRKELKALLERSRIYKVSLLTTTWKATTRCYPKLSSGSLRTTTKASLMSCRTAGA